MCCHSIQLHMPDFREEATGMHKMAIGACLPAWRLSFTHSSMSEALQSWFLNSR